MVVRMSCAEMNVTRSFETSGEGTAENTRARWQYQQAHYAIRVQQIKKMMATSAARPARSKDCDIHCDALGYDLSTLTSWVGLHAMVSDFNEHTDGCKPKRS
jgi:hypothetical protein